MDTLTLNAVGITVMAIFGLWAFYRAADHQKRRREDEKKTKSARTTSRISTLA